MSAGAPAAGTSGAAGASGGTPFPEGDPRNAAYFENLAALEHALTTTLASDQHSLADAQSGYNYSTGELARQLPLTMQATRNTANSQGLLESGQLAQRTGTVEATYAAKRGQLASTLRSNEDKIHANEQAANEAFNLGRVKAANEALSTDLKQTEGEAPNEQTPAASPPTKLAPQAPTVVSQHAQRPSSSPAPRGPRLRTPTVGKQRGAGNQGARRRAAMRAVRRTGGTQAEVG